MRMRILVLEGCIANIYLFFEIYEEYLYQKNALVT